MYLTEADRVPAASEAWDGDPDDVGASASEGHPCPAIMAFGRARQVRVRPARPSARDVARGRVPGLDERP